VLRQNDDLKNFAASTSAADDFRINRKGITDQMDFTGATRLTLENVDLLHLITPYVEGLENELRDGVRSEHRFEAWCPFEAHTHKYFGFDLETGRWWCLRCKREGDKQSLLWSELFFAGDMNETGIVWLTDPRTLPFVREHVVPVPGRAGAPDYVGSGDRLVAYAELDAAVPADARAGKTREIEIFRRRIFWLRDTDPHPSGDVPHESVHPLAVLPTIKAPWLSPYRRAHEDHLARTDEVPEIHEPDMEREGH
jgi:hypothetical protein